MDKSNNKKNVYFSLQNSEDDGFCENEDVNEVFAKDCAKLLGGSSKKEGKGCARDDAMKTISFKNPVVGLHEECSPGIFRFFLLALLTANCSTTVLLLRISRKDEEATPYLVSTAIFVSEVVKFISCVSFLVVTEGFTGGFNVIKNQILLQPKETSKLAIPAILYALQNNLFFLALGYLDSASYQVTSQLKILTTAFCSVLILKRRLSSRQWGALTILTLGVILVQMQNFTKDDADAKKNLKDHERIKGLLFVIAGCFSSGAAGVYYESLVKTGQQQSVIIRNLQLNLISLPSTFVVVAYKDWDRVNQGGFFQGYSALIWSIVAFQAYGGLLVGVVVKYADNILKGFAVSVSIIICSVVSYFIEESGSVRITDPTFISGVGFVTAAVYLYNSNSIKSAVPNSGSSSPSNNGSMLSLNEIKIDQR